MAHTVSALRSVLAFRELPQSLSPLIDRRTAWHTFLKEEN
jgi:hypothetical protein